MNYIIYALLTAAFFFSFAKLFPLAGRKSWEGLVPVYNLYVWLKVIHKPWWYLLLLIFPGVNVLMLAIMSVNTATVFGKREPADVAFFGFLPFIALPKLALEQKIKYVGPIDRAVFKKNTAMEWRDAILFAVVAASIIRTYFMEAFTIPTSSMEKTLLKGDFLFVSKFHYGPRIPQTPLSFPFTHHTFPVINAKSYLDWIELPYYRLPALTDIERNDIVVFNFPAGDTLDTEYQSTKTYYQMVKRQAFTYILQDITQKKRPENYSFYLDKARKEIKNNRDIITRPIDKRENYIKRCVAIAGDTVTIDNGLLFVNGVKAMQPEEMQYKYKVKTKEPFALRSERVKRQLKDDYLIDFEDQFPPVNGSYLFPLTDENSRELEQNPNVKSVDFYLHESETFDKMIEQELYRIMPQEKAQSVIKYFESVDFYDPFMDIYPNTPEFNWTVDIFGPLVVPKKGMTVELNENNLAVYKRVITGYEGKDLFIREGKVFIDNVEADHYTFEMDYYWMMGDNRHNSQDSRFWGFVPENHVVGKAVFIWLSLDPDYGLFDGKIRWSRLFSVI